MPGGLFFGPHIRASQPGDRTIEFNRAMAAIFPLGVMTFLVLVCFICAECVSRKNRKKKHPGTKSSVPRHRRPAPDPRFLSPDNTSRGELLRTPSSSLNSNSDDGRIDFSDLSFEYGSLESVSKKSEFRVDLEGTYAEPRDSPQPPPSARFGRLKDSLPGLYRKEDELQEEDEMHGFRSPSPTQPHQGMMGSRYGAWVRSPPFPPPPSSETSDSDQSMQFQMSMSDDDKKMTIEEQKEKAHRRLQREKKRLKREKQEENAAIIMEQMNWTVKDEYSKRLRESRAIPIPPRSRTEERQRIVRAKAEGFTIRPTVLPFAFNQGRIVEVHHQNPPSQAGASSHRNKQDSALGRAQALLLQDAVKNLEIIEGHVGSIAHEPLGQNYRFGDAPEPLYQNRESVRKAVEQVSNAPEPLYQDCESVRKAGEQVSNAPEPVYQDCESVRKAGEQVSHAPEPLYQDCESVREAYGPVDNAPEPISKDCGAVRKAKGAQRKLVGDAPEPLYQNYGSIKKVRGAERKLVGDAPEPLYQNYGSIKKVKDTERKLARDSLKYRLIERKDEGEEIGVNAPKLQFIVRKDKGQEVGDAPEPMYQSLDSLKEVISAEKKLVGDAPKALNQKCGTVRKTKKGQEVGDAPEPMYYDNVVRRKSKTKIRENVSQPLFHHYGAITNYGALSKEVHPLGTFTTEMLEENLTATLEDELEKREKAAEARRVRAKIGKAVYNVEMARLQDEMKKQKLILERNRKKAEKDREESPLDTEASGLTRTKKDKDPNVVELVEKGLKILGLDEVPQGPSASGLVRRKSVTKIEDDDETVVLGDALSSSWEDIEPEKKYVWWAGIGDRKKKSSKQKKHGRK